MEGATLTIALRDESNQGQGSPATTPQAGSAPHTAALTEDQQKAITAAGGIGRAAEQGYSQATTSTSVPQPAVATAATVPVAAPLPTPIATATQGGGADALSQSIQKIVSADPKATAEEIAKLLGGGTTAREVERLMQPMAAPPQPIPTIPVQAQQTPFAQSLENLNLVFPFTDLEPTRINPLQDFERQQQATRDAAARNIPRPPPLSREQILEESERSAPPVLSGPLNVTSQVQTTVNAISHFAHMAGPLGSAAAGVANAAVAIPGIAQAIGTAAPALVAAAPYVALAAAAAAIPATAIAVTNNEANRAIAVSRQFSSEVIGAEAQADVRQILADMRSARVVGDEAAQLVDARSRSRAALQGVRDRLSEPLLEDFAQFNNAVAKMADAVNRFLETNPSASRAVSQGVIDAAGGLTFGAAYWAYKLTGNLFGKSPDDFAGATGLLGIVPQRPNLPFPFTEGGVEDVQRITTSGLSLGDREVSPGGRRGF